MDIDFSDVICDSDDAGYDKETTDDDNGKRAIAHSLQMERKVPTSFLNCA